MMPDKCADLFGTVKGGSINNQKQRPISVFDQLLKEFNIFFRIDALLSDVIVKLPFGSHNREDIQATALTSHINIWPDATLTPCFS